MSVIRERSTWTAIGLIWALVAGSPAAADDTELFVSNTSQTSAAKPNILFIVDTSGSMDTEVVTQATYDPNTSYSGSCDANRVYWRSGAGDPPTCSTNRWFDQSALKCQAALDAFAGSAGRYTDTMGQYNPNATTGGRRNRKPDPRWEGFNSGVTDQPVECADDSGKNGDSSNPDPTLVYAMNGDPTQLWTSNQALEVAWTQRPLNTVYTVFDGNYLNWYYGPTSTSTRIQVVKDVAKSLLDTVNGVNVGLMRFNNNEGGPVIHQMQDIATARGTMKSQIDTLNANGFTPLSETLYEAGLYYMGRKVDYGNVGPTLSVPASRDASGVDYKSPLEYGCQKNFIVLLTDGEPTLDTSANNKITGLPNFPSLVAPSCDGSGDGKCLDDMAEYLYKADLDPNLPGKQNVVTYTIGFTANFPLLASTATRGGGAYFTANDTASLSSALTNIVSKILDTQTTFTSPTVSVNSFNRTQNLNDLFITVFRAAGEVHWPGNLKKYRLRASDAEIMDANANPAVDPVTGFFAKDAQSYWSSTADGPDVTLGGAANQLPAPDARNVYTYLGASALTASSNAVTKANAAITNAVLNLGNPGDPTRDQVIDFIRGWDVGDTDEDNITNEPRNQMGDPLHAQPASMIYGGTAANPEAVVYMATNDGYVHAIDSATGVEKWAFVPPEFLPDQAELLNNNSTATKHYGVDGNLQLQVLANNDGIIDPATEKVYLFFGMRRGGSFYYGLDVTDPDNPKVMWKLDGSDLPGVGQSWSTPVPARINIPGGNSDHLVLVMGGGYDTTQDNYNGSTDTVGNSIYIVDSETGALLWQGSKTGGTKDFAKMDYSIPGTIKVVDLNGDHYADRFYAADMGGQVWRFDVFNGQSGASLVNGGVIAQLGGAPAASPAIQDTRRFYYSPDVAIAQDEAGASFVHIGIGSGHRAHPNSVFNHDRFYALRDYNAFNSLSQNDYDNVIKPITDADLVDITDDTKAVVPAGSPGWRFELRDGGWIGEKVLAESRTFNNQIFFTTFTPGAGAGGNTNTCEPVLGTNRLYVVNLFNGAPVKNLDGSVDDQNLTATDRYTEFRGSISSEVVFLFPSPDDANCVGEQCTPPPVACVDLFCFPTGFANNPVRTRWSEESLE